jgi:hypothetical protein
MWIQFQEALGRAILYMVGATGLDFVIGGNRISFDSSGSFRIGVGAGGVGGGIDNFVITSTGSILMNLPTYADGSAATGGGLGAGALYKTPEGQVKIA